jgi:peptidoglycan/LPS O-acetylase OafA/YrhL
MIAFSSTVRRGIIERERPEVTSPFRPDIEGLRALSILLVVAYHYGGSLVPGGYLGVDVFFVISGYLITLTLVRLHAEHGPTRAALFEFWARRVRRLLPNAFLVLVAVSALAAAWLPAGAASRAGAEVAWASAYAINWLFIARAADYLRWGETEGSVLLNFWSLAVEEQFYLAWPLVLPMLLGVQGAARRRLRAALLAALLMLAASLMATLWWERASLTVAFYSSPLRAWELLAGAGLALHVRRGQAWSAGFVRLAPMLAWLGFVAVVASALAFDHETRHPGWLTLLPVGASVLLIAALGASPAAHATRWLGSRPLRALGARSYSIYLWHWPVWVLGNRLLTQVESGWRTVGLLTLSLLLAEAAYRWVETPARWRWAHRAPARAWLLGAALASTLLLAAGIALGEWGRERIASGQLPAVNAPSGLPPLAVTLRDLPIVYGSGCHVGIEATAPAAACRIGGAPGGKAVALVGDSHAAQWAPPLLEVAGTRGVAVLAWTKSGCPMADVIVWDAAARAPYRECERWREAVLSELQRQRPAAVLVSNLMDEATVVVDGATGATLRGSAAAAAFDAGLFRILQRLRDSGLNPVLIRDTPRARADVLDCLYSQPNPGNCERRRADAVPLTARDLRAAATAKVPAWDFTNEICGPQMCPVFMEELRRSVYRDVGHLSATFALSLAPALATRWASTPGLP